MLHDVMGSTCRVTSCSYFHDARKRVNIARNLKSGLSRAWNCLTVISSSLCDSAEGVQLHKTLPHLWFTALVV